MKQNYFAYIIECMDRNNYSYNQMKLHKLLYFAAAYENMKYEDCSILKNCNFIAYENGPVEHEIRTEYVYDYILSPKMYKKDYLYTEKLTANEKNSIEKIVNMLGKYESGYLSDLTHEKIYKDHDDTPWKEANPDGGFSKKRIDKEKIKIYYNKDWFKKLSKYNEAYEKYTNRN